MKKGLRILISVFAVSLIVVMAAPANEVGAYNCIQQSEPLDALNEYDTVFTGKVIEIKEEKIKFPEATMHKLHVTFLVDQTWQGPSQNMIEIVGQVGLLELEKDKDYLVYAYTVEKDHQIFKKGEFSTSVCSRTIELSKASYDLQQLGEGRAPLQIVQVKKRGDGINLINSMLILLLLGSLITAVNYRRKKQKNK